MRNIRLVVEYEGTSYSGWQRQNNGRTIQGTIEEALHRLIQEEVNIIGAGRTDAGVHARGQVANFRSGTHLPLRDVRNGLNALLPDDIVIHAAEEVPYDFHARFGARERCYSYTINRLPTALMRSFVWHVSYELQPDVMRWCAASIIGEHDFSSFCKSAAEVDNYRCVVQSATWEADDPLIRFTIRADRFLHGMVRALVGTMVDVGRGYRTVGEFVSLLEARDRTMAGPAAPASGLVLESVTY